MVDISTSIVLPVRTASVASYMFDPDRAPEWYENIKSVTWETPKPLALNSKVAFTAQFLGKRLSYTYRVTESSHTTLVMQTYEGPFPMETSYFLESIGPDKTRVTLRNRGNPTGFGKLMAPFMGVMMRWANRKDLKRLKERLEGIRA